MAITNGYATLAEFKLFATTRGGSASTDANDDGVIEDIIELVSRYLDVQTGRRFWKNSSDETRYFIAESDTKCRITDLSASPTTVSVDYDNSRDYTALAATDYELDPLDAALDSKPYTRLFLHPDSAEYFPAGVRNGIKVVGKFGFPSVPEDIKNLTLAIAMNIYTNRSGQSGAGDVTVTASGVVIRPRDVPKWGQQIIDSYRLYL